MCVIIHCSSFVYFVSSFFSQTIQDCLEYLESFNLDSVIKRPCKHLGTPTTKDPAAPPRGEHSWRSHLFPERCGTSRPDHQQPRHPKKHLRHIHSLSWAAGALYCITTSNASFLLTPLEFGAWVHSATQQSPLTS